MRVVNSLHALMAAVACAALIAASPALADTISTQFNFVATTPLTANTGNVTTATTITSGAPDLVTSIITDNTGLVALSSIVSLTSPTPTTLGATFTKMFDTSVGDFVETLTVSSVTAGASSLGILASGTIVETTVLSGAPLDPSLVSYSAAYTQNGGPGGQINASFNDATVPGPIVGAGLPGLLAACGALIALARRRRRQAA
jgi:hypothetical protein